MNKKLWLRSETKENEKRCALTPENAKSLIQKGIEVIVEESSERIFPTEDYKNVGCKIVSEHSWTTDATKDHYILGLKEILNEDFPLHLNHIYFAHIYKGQDGANDILNRYKKDGGTLFDLEFLTNSDGRRIAAFGYWAGYIGAALAVENYLSITNSHETSPLKHYKDKEEWLKILNDKKSETIIRPIIIGAKGRCGQGSKDLFKDLGIKSTDWDMEETKVGGPFNEILEHDIFVNTVLMTKKIKPFLTNDILSNPKNLRVICDVSCDPNSDLNPIPVYNTHTTWESPTTDSNGVSIIAIDNLPSALPKESSIDFSNQLYPHLEELLLTDESSIPWKNAKNVFKSFIEKI